MNSRRGWYSRGYLPHFDLENRTQFVTWRQADSVPSEVLKEWARELASLDDPARKKEMASRIERFCDAGRGSCVLGNPRTARVVQETLFRSHGIDFDLLAWTVMPNHVHILLRQSRGKSIGEIVRTLKGFSSNRLNKIRGAAGRLWQPDYFDTLIRDGDHFDRVVAYIEWNAAKAGLCSDPKLWEFSSANENSLACLEQISADRSDS